MFLVQILLPAFDNERRLFSKSDYDLIGAELTEKFGGTTAYVRSPAEGQWKHRGKATSRDDIVVIEVMCEDLDKAWWRAYRERLEADFRQHVVVIRAQSIIVI